MVFADFAPVLGLMTVSGASMKSLQTVWEKPFFVENGTWPFLDPWTVVGMGTTASSWNVAKKHGPHGKERAGDPEGGAGLRGTAVPWRQRCRVPCAVCA